jgi:hypothetical protein
MTVLVAIQGTAGSREAIRVAAQEARRRAAGRPWRLMSHQATPVLFGMRYPGQREGHAGPAVAGIGRRPAGPEPGSRGRLSPRRADPAAG